MSFKIVYLALLVFELCVNGYPETFDCPMRMLALEYAQQIQPFLTAAHLQEIADALNGSPEAQNCNITPSNLSIEPLNAYKTPMVWNDIDLKSKESIYVDYRNGNDKNDGSYYYPVQHIDTAIIITRNIFSSNQSKNIILRKGTHYLRDTLYLTHLDHKLLITNYNGEQVDISGAVPLSCDWKLYKNGANGKNIYSCDLTSNANITQDITGLRVNGNRAVRARYPNAIPETEGFSSNLMASSWYPSILPTKPDQEINPSTPLRNDTPPDGSGNGWFQKYLLGIGGPCINFEPPAGYWCASNTQGGGAFTYLIPSGLTYNTSTLPNAPYNDASQLVIQAWRPYLWASWMFEVGEYDAEERSMNFSKGGFQGARGDTYGGAFYVENVMEELDMAGEFFYNKTTKQLYYYNNETNQDPSNLLFEAPQLKVLLNYTGTMSKPIQNINIRGITFKDTAITYMDPHGMPSAGDWGLQRQGAIYMEGTEDCIIESNILTRLEGNAISVNRYNRNLTIMKNEIVWNGDTGITLWGDTENITFPSDKTTMGYDGTNGNQPRGINIIQNLIHEVGVWEKQSAPYFQSKSCSNNIIGNIMYNGPRSGINFNDGFGGNSTIKNNLLFNLVRESSDHGPFNSWDRQVYVTKIRSGQASTIKEYDTIESNFIIANYNGQEAIDTDDGSCYFKVYNNFFVYSNDNGLKSDFGGHDNIHHGNIYAYVANTCFSIAIGDPGGAQLVGHIDQYYNNTCAIFKDNANNHLDYGKFDCSSDQNTWPKLGDNTIYTLSTNAASQTGLCGQSEKSFQSKYSNVDANTHIFTADPTVDAQLISQAKQILFPN